MRVALSKVAGADAGGHQSRLAFIHGFQVQIGLDGFEFKVVPLPIVPAVHAPSSRYDAMLKKRGTRWQDHQIHLIRVQEPHQVSDPRSVIGDGLRHPRMFGIDQERDINVAEWSSLSRGDGSEDIGRGNLGAGGAIGGEACFHILQGEGCFCSRYGLHGRGT